MCLELPIQLREVPDVGPALGCAAGGGPLVPIDLIMLDEPVSPGDWVVAHSGYALRRVPADDVALMVAARSEGRPSRDRSPPQEAHP